VYVRAHFHQNPDFGDINMPELGGAGHSGSKGGCLAGHAGQTLVTKDHVPRDSVSLDMTTWEVQ